MTKNKIILSIIEDSEEQINILKRRVLNESDKDQIKAFEIKISHHQFIVTRMETKYLNYFI